MVYVNAAGISWYFGCFLHVQQKAQSEKVLK